MSNPNPPLPGMHPPAVAPIPAPRPLAFVLLLALAAYAVFLALSTTTVAGGPDASGYLNSARLLASGHLQGELRVPAEFGPQSDADRVLFTTHGFYPYPDNPALPPTYPVGLPLHFAAAGKLFGWHLGPLVIEVGGALAALWLCYLTARELGVGPVLAAAGAVALGVCPVFLFTSTQPLSDTLATTWSLAAVYTALRARRHRGWAAACGAAFAIAVLVRPTNAVLLPSLVVLLGLDWRRLALAALSGIPGALWLGYYNHTLYGGALKSGYGDWRVSFALSYVPGTLLHFALWLALLLPCALLVLPFAAPFARDFRNRTLVALTLWFGAIIALYSSYVVSHEVWWCLRFILPAIPALILAALLGLEALALRFPTGQRPRLLTAAAFILALWAVAGSTHWNRKLGTLTMKGREQIYADASLAALRLFPADSLVVSFYTCGALYAYTDFSVLRWDLLKPAQFAHFASLAKKSGRPVCALLLDSEEKEALHERCPGEWTRLGSVRNATLWRLTASTPPSAAK